MNSLQRPALPSARFTGQPMRRVRGAVWLRQRRGPGASRERGMVLFLVMVFLLITSSLVLTAGRTTILNESVTRNVLDRSLAAQAAEAALNDGMRDLFVIAPSSFNGSCKRPDAQRPLFAYAFRTSASTPATEAFNSQCRRGLCDWTSDGTDYSSYAGGNNPWKKASVWNNQDTATKQSACSATTQSTSDFIGGVPIGTYTGAASVPGVWRQPEYMIEVFKGLQGDDAQKAVFRITSRGFGADTRTEVMLQMVLTGTPGADFDGSSVDGTGIKHLDTGAR